MADDFKKYKSPSGAVTLTRKGSGYDKGLGPADAGTAGALSDMVKQNKKRNVSNDTSIRSIKGTSDAPFFKHTQKDCK